MFRLAALCLLVGASLAAPFSSELDGHWAQFKQMYGKNYNDIEDVARRAVWEHNVALVQQHNLDADMGLRSYRLGVNQHADLRDDEVKRMRGFKPSKAEKKPAPQFLAPANVQLPESVDWREHGYVTPVKDQGQCGSCWAFSATGSLEGQHFRQTGKLVSLSEQNLVDCSGAYGNEGCDGGLMDQAFAYIKDNKGIDTELSYPYTAEDGTCVFSKASVGAEDTGFVDVASGSEAALMKAVATVGPVSVAIDASNFSFQLYQEGVYEEDDCSPVDLDHGVLVVGYGQENGKDYWLVKNSWGESWGENGYIKVARNKNNMCGIATQASYPLV